MVVLSLLVVFGMLFAACKPAPEEAPAAEEPVAEEAMEEEAEEMEEAEEEAMEEEAMEAPTQVQFCTLYSTSITDNGWDVSGHESFLRFAENPGADIEVLELKFIEGLWGDEAEAAMRAYAEGGCDIIWSHGGYNDIILNIYQSYPDTMFIEVGSGWIDGDANNYHYMNRCHDGSYLMGVLAGSMSESDVIGVAGGYPAEDVNDNINGFVEGYRTVRPDAALKIGFINSWYDPVAAGELAEAQKAAGAEMLYMLAENFDVCGPDQGAMCFGPYIDFSQLYPGNVIASFYTQWDDGYEFALNEWLKAKASGEWNGGPLGFENSMATGACDIILGQDIEFSDDVLATFEATRAGILDGSIVPTLNTEEPTSD